MLQNGAVLIRYKTESRVEPLGLDPPPQLRELPAATNAEEYDVALVAQLDRRGEHCLKFVGTAEIARITDHELAIKLPGRSERITLHRNRLERPVVGPVRDDMDAGGLDAAIAQSLCHCIAKDHVRACDAQ